MVEGIHMCKDGMHFRPEERAKRVKAGQDLTQLRLPGGASVISHNDPIRVIRPVEGTGDDGTPEEFAISTFEAPELDVERVSPDPSNYAARPEAADTSAPDVEQHVGGVPTQRSTTLLSKTADVNSDEATTRSGASVAPAKPKKKPWTNRTRVNPKADQPQAETPEVATTTTPTKKKSIVLASPTMGRVRLKVPYVAVSDSVVIIGYVDDDDAQIVEPPAVGLGDTDNHIQVTYDGDTYACAYLGFTAEANFGGEDLFLVVLIRAPE